MPRRLLNIASIVCLVACVALMGMWVRSYRTLGDELHYCVAAGKDMLGFMVFSTDGEMILCEGPLISTGTRNAITWPWIDFTTPDGNHLAFQVTTKPQSVGNSFGFGYILSPTASGMLLPYWFLVLMTGLLAMLFQLRWPPRFTLRSLFFATTFLAIVMGMVAWLDRAWIGQ
jgi:hypothetical protein